MVYFVTSCSILPFTRNKHFYHRVFYHKVNILQYYYAFSSNVSFHIQQVLKL